METPYSKDQAELERLVEEGRQILSRYAECRKLKGQVDIGAGVARQFGLARVENIDTIGRGIKAVATANESLGAIEMTGWYSRFCGVVRGLHTGRRRCELSDSTKARFLHDLSVGCVSKSPRALMSKGVSLASRILLEVSRKNSTWTPKGKMITAGRLLMGREEVETILAKETDRYVKVCDPHISPTTLRMLEIVPSDIPVSLLTVKIHDSARVDDYLETMRRRRPNFRVAAKENRPQPHDRYIITGRKAWIVGASLKDIGNKDALIHELTNRTEVEEMIDEYLGEMRGQVRWL